MNEIDPALVAAMETDLDWTGCPQNTAAFIEVCVDNSQHLSTPIHRACWLMDDGVSTHPTTPRFVGFLEEGQAFSVRRPELQKQIIERIASLLWWHHGFNSKLELMDPEPGYTRPAVLKPHPLSVGVRKGVHADTIASIIRAKRQPTHSGERA